MVLERNWLDVYKYTKWTGNTIPTLREGDSVPFMMDMVQSRTEPPPLLTEGDLISIMDKSKIGTDATIATHIKTIQDRQYVTLDNRSQFSPTKLGLALYEGYEDMGYKLMKPYLRCDMERDVGRIARGELSKDVAIKACLDSMKGVY
jgi:DNA topoisomerase-3